MTDVQMLEEHHKESAVENYADTSKRIRTHLIEMTDISRRVQSEDTLDFDENSALQNVYSYQSSVNISISMLNEDTTYERINNLGESVLKFNQSSQRFDLLHENEKYTLHPFLTFRFITDLLLSFSEDFNDSQSSSAIKQIISGDTSSYFIQCEKGILIRPSTDSGVAECIIQANSHQKRLVYTKRYDSVELFTDSDELDYQQVLCIISIIELHTSQCIDNLVILCKYRVVEQNHAHILPYTELTYDIQRQKLPITICRIEDVNRPLCVIPRREYLQDQYLSPSQTNIPTLQQIRMWAFTLKYVDRNSWTNYNAVYSIAQEENENNSKFLMHENTLRALMQQRIAKNRALGDINDDFDELSDIE